MKNNSNMFDLAHLWWIINKPKRKNAELTEGFWVSPWNFSSDMKICMNAAHWSKFIPWQLSNLLRHTSSILDINVMVNWHLSKQGIRWPVSHDHIAGSINFWSWPPTRDWLLIGSQAHARSDAHTHTWTRLNFSRSFCGYTAMLRQQKLLTVDAFRVQVRFGKYIFLAFFAGFSPGLT